MPNLKIMLPQQEELGPNIEFTIRAFAALKTIYTAITAMITKNKIIISTSINVILNLNLLIY